MQRSGAAACFLPPLLLGPGSPAPTIYCSRLIWTRHGHGRTALVAVQWAAGRLPRMPRWMRCPSPVRHPQQRDIPPCQLKFTHLPCLKNKKSEQDPGPGGCGVSLPAPAGPKTHWPVDHDAASPGSPIFDPMGDTYPAVDDGKTGCGATQ